jgi:P-type Cu2+ transporter
MAGTGFCCPGCAYVHRLIHEHGLDAYYTIKDPVTAPADPAVFQPRDYAWLDAAQALAEAREGPPVRELAVDIQGISCAGCVWLIERLFREEAGARGIVVNAQTGSMRLRWSAGSLRLSDWARRLQAFGYLAGPAGENPQDLESRALVRRIGLCAAFAMNVMLFALPAYFGMRPDFEYAGLFRMLTFLFATLSVLAGGTYFIGRAVRVLRAGAAHIDLPIAIGIAGSYCGSVYGWLTHQDRFVYFDFVATFIVLMLAGRWAQVVAVERNRRRLLQQEAAPQLIRLGSGGESPREQVPPGSVILVGAGQTLPVEARLEDSAASFSLASISGEPEPRLFQPGQRVPAGALNVDRADARLTTLQTWKESLLAQLLAPPELTGRRASILETVVRGYVYGVLTLAVAAGAGWWLSTHDPVRAGLVVTAVLVVSCPCAIGLALPLADEMATAALRRRGVYVRENDVWSRLGRVRRILFDKTGTLTLETPVLLNPDALAALAPADRAALLGLVREAHHPVSQCIAENLLVSGAGEPPEGRVEETVGRGVFLGPWSLGRAGWRDSGPPGPDTVFARDGRELARLRFGDAPRPGAAADVGRLRAMGFEVLILSGDSRARVASLAEELGLPPGAALGEMGPEEKAAWVDRHCPDDALMLGDGANDSLAFDRALCRGTPVIHRGVLERKADFYYLRRGIDGIVELFAVERARRRTQGAIIAFSVAYNAVAAGLAVAGLVSPLVAAIVMPASSLVSLFLATAGMGRSRLSGAARLSGGRARATLAGHEPGNERPAAAA